MKDQNSNKNIGIVSGNRLKYSPYLRFYYDLLKDNDINCILINKEVTPEDITLTNQFSFIQSQDIMKMNYFRRTLKWYRFLINELRCHECNKIIVSPTRTGIILFPLLISHNIKFLLDIRDFTNESSKLYRIIEKRLLDLASMVVISSEGFKRWLPKTKTKISVVHNMGYKQKVTQNTVPVFTKEFITISYIGTIGYYDANRQLIDAFVNDDKFRLHYAGAINQGCLIETYAKEKNAENVIFTGPFNNEDKAELYSNTDIINAFYGNDSLIVSTALPNKLYDAVLYRKPIIASKGTYLGKLVEQYQLGVTVEADSKKIHDLIIDYINKFDFNVFSNNCDIFLKDVIEIQNKTIADILDFTKS